MDQPDRPTPHPTDPATDFDTLMDSSSLGAPHVEAAQEPVPTKVRRQLALAARQSAQRAGARFALGDPRVLALAAARQQLAHEGLMLRPTWSELTDAEREDSLPDARAYLEALARAGLLATPPDSDPTPPGEHPAAARPDLDGWDPRLDVIEALEADGWTGDAMAGEPLRKNGALWITIHDGGESSLDGPNGSYSVSFTPEVPAAVVIAACRAAARPADPPPPLANRAPDPLWDCTHCGEKITGPGHTWFGPIPLPGEPTGADRPRYHLDRDPCRVAGGMPPRTTTG